MEGKDKIERALLKVALGFQVAEVTEEYAEVDGELKLTKRKKTKKDVPPDLKAVQLLLMESGENIAAMSDEELEREKQRLLSQLQNATKKQAEEGKEVGQVCVEKKATATAKRAKKESKPRAKAKKRVVKKKNEEGV